MNKLDLRNELLKIQARQMRLKEDRIILNILLDHKKGETMIPEDLSQIDHNLTAEELDTVCRGLEDGIGQIYDRSENYGAASYTLELNSYLYEIDELFDTVSRITRVGVQ
jgi:hypothetical protein